MSAQSSTTSSGLGLSSVLTLIFVVLKLVHVIDWSWWWVLSPLWISLGLSLVIVGIIVLVAVIATAERR